MSGECPAGQSGLAGSGLPLEEHAALPCSRTSRQHPVLLGSGLVFHFRISRLRHRKPEAGVFHSGPGKADRRTRPFSQRRGPRIACSPLLPLLHV
jgi:hypothetical protein